MHEDITKFRQICRYKISQGDKITSIAKEVGIAPMTLDAILKDKVVNFRSSTIASLQDFIRKHNTFSDHENFPKEEVKETPEETNYSVLEFFVRVRELLQGVPKGYKCKIEIEKT